MTTDNSEPVIDDQGRPEPPTQGDEVQTLLGFLDYQRATLQWRCRGLGAAQLQVKTAASAITLGGLLKHMTFVEDEWFARWLPGSDRLEPWRSVDWGARPEWEWETAANDEPQHLRDLWQQSVERSRASVAAVLETGDLSHVAARTWPNGDSPSLRWILVHMIEEYARHNGHADFLREAIDGETGE